MLKECLVDWPENKNLMKVLGLSKDNLFEILKQQKSKDDKVLMTPMVLENWRVNSMILIGSTGSLKELIIDLFKDYYSSFSNISFLHYLKDGELSTIEKLKSRLIRLSKLVQTKRYNFLIINQFNKISKTTQYLIKSLIENNKIILIGLVDLDSTQNFQNQNLIKALSYIDKGLLSMATVWKISDLQSKENTEQFIHMYILKLNKMYMNKAENFSDGSQLKILIEFSEKSIAYVCSLCDGNIFSMANYLKVLHNHYCVISQLSYNKLEAKNFPGDQLYQDDKYSQLFADIIKKSDRAVKYAENSVPKQKIVSIVVDEKLIKHLMKTTCLSTNYESGSSLDNTNEIHFLNLENLLLEKKNYKLAIFEVLFIRNKQQLSTAKILSRLAIITLKGNYNKKQSISSEKFFRLSRVLEELNSSIKAIRTVGEMDRKFVDIILIRCILNIYKYFQYEDNL
ncbi:uncharacterized protein ASCRUDRAFT_72993 [Ascoidea rubescens DSM 1968]|uniref:Uncharacterized protein n=1 Tax=Ascoidea rubescens DSM 1968 TaxID=1344418 RepID=A0A1D2V8L4_9ASCO|nr:hypothetical protein ASCRUDRAFT_72993 [Ascoidea rubescens DSM 1968]ODV57992.1 hypothetical protein ASCRUDRAFT_72993 [Ascoidea rubescens DSM 1968]